MLSLTRSAFAALAILTLSAPAQLALAEDTRVLVTIENLAPQRGTHQTPFWVGFHDGSFDTYDGNTPASSNPSPGSIAMESICEDGDTAAISADFASITPDGTDATLPGPAGPPAPGQSARGSFVLDSTAPASRYFSYASMVLPSNDFCISNGNPLAHEIFDDSGNVVAQSFFVTGAEVLDAGTEVNDELPQNTAFFGQAAPNTGVDENGNIGDAGDLAGFAGFMPPGARLDPPNILGTPAFAMGDFTLPGYPMVKISFATAPAIVDDQAFAAELSGSQEVPPVERRSAGWAAYALRDAGTRLSFKHRFSRLGDVVAAHLHLGAEGKNGPVVAFLLPADLDELSRQARRRLRRGFSGEIGEFDLVGPLEGQPLDALIAQIQAGNVYVNIHTERVPSGEIRGQLELY